MLRVRDLMRTEPPTIEPEETLRSAVEMLVTAGTGGAPVVSGGRLVGVVSLSDVLAFEAGEPGIPTYRPEMSSASSGDDDMTEAEAEEEEESGTWFRDLYEDVGPDVVTRLEQADGPEWDDLDQHSVAEVMTRTVVAVAPGDTVQKAARVMDNAGVHRVVVIEGSEVVGILGARDIVRAVAGGLLVPARKPRVSDAGAR
jgi:CBS domain-containing protein